MSQDDWEEGELDEDPQEEDCPYSFEFCEDPQTREMGLCATECSLYMNSVEEDEKQPEKEEEE